MKVLALLGTCLLLLTCLPAASYAYFITVDAHSEECFFDRAESGTKLGELFTARKKVADVCINNF